MDELIEKMARAIEANTNGGESAWDCLDEEWRRTYRSSARASLVALTQAGYAVVPLEPTYKMGAAGRDAVDRYATEIAPCSMFRALDAYRAMVNAALDTQQREG